MHGVFHLLNRRQHLILDCWCYWLNHTYTQVEFSTLILEACCWPTPFTTSLFCWCVNKKRQKKQEGEQRVIANFVTGKYLLISVWCSSYKPVILKLPPCSHWIHSPESTCMETEMNVSNCWAYQDSGKSYGNDKNTAYDWTARTWSCQAHRGLRKVWETITLEIQQQHFH